MSDSPQEHDPLDEAFAAYLHCCDTGQLHSREEFIAQFPELADQLRQLIEAADLMDQVALGRPSDAPGGEMPNADDSTPAYDAETIVLRADGRFDPGQGARDDDAFSFDDQPGRAEAFRRSGSANNPEQRYQGVNDLEGDDLDGGDPEGDDRAVTLPVAHRAQGDPGPTLPYELGTEYVLIQELGRGGMGVVYLAEQKGLHRMVAVKMIRSGILADATEVKRFYTEAQAAAKLHHPGIVSVYQINRYEGHHFFSMEYVPGTDLQRKINSGLLSPHQAARYVRDVALAIHHAHQKGVLHRDLKPANVLIDEHDQIHVTDFGLAKHMDADSSVTGSGAAVGTPHYMAPEQAGGHSDRACRQSDVYALGAILFASVTGRPPIVAETVMQTLLKVIHQPAPLARSLRPDVPVDLETIIAKCLEKKPNKRYQSAKELADELSAFLEGRPIAARPRSRAVKVWHWLEGVPLIAALMGRRVLHPSTAHKRFQAGLLLLVLLTPIFAAALFMMWQQGQNRIPGIVRIAGGVEGGIYDDVAHKLAERLKTEYGVATQLKPASGGSLANRDLLLSGAVDIAPMQATALSGDRLSVVAPLFYEVLYVLAHAESGIQSIHDLPGHRVAVGPEGSGSRRTAELVFDSLRFDRDRIKREVVRWQRLFENQPPDAAMICIGRGSGLVHDLLATGKWKMVPIPTEVGIQIANQHPSLRPTKVKIDGSSGIGKAGDVQVATVATTAFLAARRDAPGELIAAVLNVLYRDPPLCDDLIPPKQAAEWQEIAYHPVARQYYQRLRQTWNQLQQGDSNENVRTTEPL